MKKNVKIVICDDEATAISIVSASVEALLSSKGICGLIEKFTSAKRCMAYLKANAVDLIFLDIAMPEIDGIEFGRKILSLQQVQHPDIIFVSSNQDRVFDSLDIQPFGFVRKDNFMNDIAKVMNRYVEKRLAKQEDKLKFEIRDGEGVKVLDASSINYIESYRNTQTIHLTDGASLTMHATMDSVMDQLKDYSFIRIHKGYIVGCQNIKQFGRNEVVLFSGERLPVGRVYYQKAMESYMTFIRQNGIVGLG